MFGRPIEPRTNYVRDIQVVGRLIQALALAPDYPGQKQVLCLLNNVLKLMLSAPDYRLQMLPDVFREIRDEFGDEAKDYARTPKAKRSAEEGTTNGHAKKDKRKEA